MRASLGSEATDTHRSDLWNLPIRFVKGVGPKRTNVLQRLHIETVEDALWTIPWRYGIDPS
jgi:ATP-dependent DNA helicase RecG